MELTRSNELLNVNYTAFSRRGRLIIPSGVRPEQQNDYLCENMYCIFTLLLFTG